MPSKQLEKITKFAPSFCDERPVQTADQDGTSVPSDEARQQYLLRFISFKHKENYVILLILGNPLEERSVFFQVNISHGCFQGAVKQDEKKNVLHNGQRQVYELLACWSWDYRSYRSPFSFVKDMYLCLLQVADTELGIDVLMEKMKRLTETNEEEITQEELLKRFEKIENLSAERK